MVSWSTRTDPHSRRPVAISILTWICFVLRDFERRTNGRTTCVKIVITTGRPRGSISRAVKELPEHKISANGIGQKWSCCGMGGSAGAQNQKQMYWTWNETSGSLQKRVWNGYRCKQATWPSIKYFPDFSVHMKIKYVSKSRANARC